MNAILSKLSIRSQVLIAMVLVGGLTLAIVTTQSLHCVHEGLMASQHRTFSLFLNQQRRHLETWVREHETSLQLVATSPAIPDLLADPTPTGREVVQAYLQSSQDRSGDIEVLALYDAAGQLLVAGRSGAHHGQDLLDPALIAAIRTSGKLAWSEQAHIHDPDYMAIHVGLPVRDAAGELAGFLAASIELDKAIGIILDSSVDGDSTLRSYLVDSRSHDYLSVPESRRRLLGRRAAIPFDQPDPHLHHGSAAGLLRYHDADGTPVMAMASGLPRFGWLLVVEVDQSDAFAMLSFLMRRAAYSGVAVSVLIVILALLGARLLTRPLLEVTNACKRVASGATDHRLAEPPGREAGELAEAFNTMLDRLTTMQRELVQASALAAVGEMSASIVHEMRNPLNTIQMNLAVMGSRLADDRRVTELYQLAERQTRRLQDMLNSLLDFSKPVSLKITRQDIRPIIEEAVGSCRDLAAGQHVTVHLELPPQPLPAAVDAEHLYRVVVNLVENAIQVQPNGGEVRLSAGVAGGQARIEVVDRGPGLTESMRDRIFMPFFTTRQDGTGLGLTIVKKIVDLHLGSIDLESDPGQGARIRVSLPQHSQGAE